MLLLEQETISKWQVHKLLKLELKVDVREDKKYKVKAIKDSTIFTKTTKSQLAELYNLISCKNYLEDGNIWGQTLAIMHFWKIICISRKDYPKNRTTTFLPIDFASPCLSHKLSYLFNKNITKVDML